MLLKALMMKINTIIHIGITSLAQTTYPCLPTAITWPCLNFSF
uniref:Uncharacterized protein n=1 Tax=Anguilla anguilla TaxID=7936 RepID=A0A0E9SQS3_ANGAN